jgi:hypothetical protein
VTAKGEWPLIGAALGLPSPPPVSFSSWGDPSHDQLTYCAPPAVAYRLQQLYQDSLRHFDQVYISSSAVLRSRNQSDQVIVNGPQPPQQQATELSPQPQPTEAHRQTLLAHVPSESALGVPQHATAFVEQNAQPVNLAPTSGVQVAAHSSLQSTQSHMQQQQKEVCLALSQPSPLSYQSKVAYHHRILSILLYLTLSQSFFDTFARASSHQLVRSSRLC